MANIVKKKPTSPGQRFVVQIVEPNLHKGAPIFRTDTKFNSGTGWPSFFNPIEGSITYHEDNAHGMKRVEVRSASSGIHLGHVFDDGPPPTGKRYCINGKVLKFIPD